MSKVTIQELKELTSIVDIIGQYVTLKKAGNTFKGLCPFHNEKTPSFVVDPEKKLYHCFGCGESGDVFNFLMKMQNIDFKESVETIAKYYGYELVKAFSKNKNFNNKKKLLLSINEIALQQYKEMLFDEKGKKALEYINKDRNISIDMIKLFEMGFIYDEWDIIANIIQKMEFTQEDIEKSSLILKSSRSNKLYDRFRYRIMFPIYDEKDNLIAFAGRIFGNGKTTGDNPPKYINSSENDIFKKSEVLYNLNMAKNDIKNSGTAIITEGYFDVVACYQNGIRNVVAPMGTALTLKQLKKLEKYADKLVLMFDGDPAGIKAAIKSIDIAIQTTMEVYVVNLPDGKDPHDFVMSEGKDKLLFHIKNGQSGLDYKLSIMMRDHNMNTAKGIENYINDVFAFIKNTKNTILIDIALRKLSGLTNISEGNVRSLYDKYKKQNNSYRNYYKDSNAQQVIINVAETPIEKFQKVIISTLLANIDKADLYIPKLNEDMFSVDFYNKIFLLMKEILAQEGFINIKYFYEYFQSEKEEELFNELLKSCDEYKLGDDELEKMLIDTINNLKFLHIERRITKVEKLMVKAEKERDFNLLKEYMEERQYLLNERDKYYKAKWNIN